MSEFIGSRISLISRSDIRYVGRLHDINSENHTVALEQVVSHGTEGRRGDPGKEIAGSENVYEYIVFRGGDVKDLRIEETASQPRPQVPDDPAILGSSSRRPPPPNYAPRNPQPPNQFQQTIPPYYYPPPQAQGQYGPGPYPQGAAMYGAYPPPQGQAGLGPVPSGIPQGQQQSPQLQQQQPPQQQSQAQPLQQAQLAPQQTQPTGPQNKAPPQAPIGYTSNRQQQSQPQQVNHGSMQQQAPSAQNSVRQSQAPMQQSAPVGNGDLSASHAPVHQPTNEGQESPTPPQENEPIPTPPASVAQNTSRASAGHKAHGGIVPALPLPSHSRQSRSPASNPAQPVPRTAAPTTESLAVTPMSNDTNAAVQDLANKVNQLAMKTVGPGPANAATNATSTPTNSTHNGPSAEHRTARGPGTGGFVARGRGNYRGARGDHFRKVEVPSTDYDFESANAKFNKRGLVKEVTAGGEDEKVIHVESPTGGTNGTADGNSDDVMIPPPAKGFYNPGSSFFDNISCENKERAEAKDGDKPRGGAIWRGEEQKKNLETFGQGSVDGGFSHFGRGGWRGRGRGRGYRGRGYSRGYGGGAPRGGVHYGGTVTGGAN